MAENVNKIWCKQVFEIVKYREIHKKIILSHEGLKNMGKCVNKIFFKICPKIGDFLARRPLCVCFLCRKSASSLVWPAFSNVFSIVDV